MREDLNVLLNEVLGALAPMGAEVLVNESIYARLRLSNGWFVVCEGDYSSNSLTLYISSSHPRAVPYVVWQLMKVFEELKGANYGAPTLQAQCAFLLREAPELFTTAQDYATAYHCRGQWEPSSVLPVATRTPIKESSESKFQEAAFVSQPASPVPAISSGTRVTLRRYMVLHWRGRLPLAVSYWINSGLITLLVYIVIGTMAEVLRSTTSWSNGFIAGLAIVPMLAVFVWGSVGTWRAGTVYDLNSRWPLGACAKFVLLIAAVRMAYAWT